MANRLTVAFSPENTLLVTNTLLQFWLLGVLNIGFILTTTDNWTYTMAMSSLVLVITTQVLLPATYETSKKNRGLYFDSVDRYNELGIMACCLTFLLLVYELIKQQSILSYLSTILLINIAWRYIKEYLLERGNMLSYVGLDKDDDRYEDSSNEFNTTPSDSLSEIDNVNSDTNVNHDTTNNDQQENQTENQNPDSVISSEPADVNPTKFLELRPWDQQPVGIVDNFQEEESRDKQCQAPEKEREFEADLRVALEASQNEIINIVLNNLGTDKDMQPQENQKENQGEFVNLESSNNSEKPNNVVLAQYGYNIDNDGESRRTSLMQAVKEHNFESVLEKLRILSHFQVPPHIEEMNSDIEYLEMNYLVVSEKIQNA